jgi:organic hydroperoxide reductase OsmC/OhrA
MSQYKANVSWTRNGAAFVDNRYSRGHLWRFDGGAQIPASSSPHVVPPPMSDPAAVDPEEAFIASLSSCHMLWFLYFAAKGKFVVDSYVDDAVGILGKDAGGRTAITQVTLYPKVDFSGPPPTEAQLREMHDKAHEQCFIANSVKSELRCQPRP